MTLEAIDRTCIIGGGAMGIAIAKNLIQAGRTAFDLIEKEDDLGGTWYFGASAGKVYESTHLISSKQNTEFSDYPMPSDYPDYPSHEQYLRYLRDFARHFGVYDYTECNLVVEKLWPNNDQEEYWNVQLSNGELRQYRTVIIANGRLGEPVIPSYTGVFSGESIHSNDYRSGDQLRRKRVLIVGAGNSGCDIAIDSVYFGEQTFLSMRRPYHFIPKFIDGMPYQKWMAEQSSHFESTEAFHDHARKVFKQSGYDPTDFGLPKPDYAIDQAHPIINSQVLYHVGHGDITIKPDIEKFEGNTVYFTDGSEDEVDAIVYATGYDLSFPFLMNDAVDWLDDGLPNFFLYTFHRNYDNLLFAGYLNAASGLGNLATAFGKLLVAFLNAQERNSQAYQIFCRLKQGTNPDLGHEYFLKTSRHKYEVDMWKLLQTINTLTGKLNT